MKNFLLIILTGGMLSIIPHLLLGQTIIDFEDIEVPVDSFLNGQDANGGFATKDVFFVNHYIPDPMFPSWSGWSISNKTDTLTPGFMNQYSVITGSGFENSTNFAVSFNQSVIRLEHEAAGMPVAGMYITNNTYTYLSMQDGDAFAKKFGGVTGDDPDFFLLTIKKYLDGNLSTDSVDFYLADFRAEDNSQDYIVKDWTFVDLSSLGAVDSLVFSLSSSDVGQFGMNTPAYFCVDQILLGNTTSVPDFRADHQLEVFPNPTQDMVRVQHQEAQPLVVRVFDLHGQLKLQVSVPSGAEAIDMRNLASGTYILDAIATNRNGHWTQLVVKQ